MREELISMIEDVLELNDCDWDQVAQVGLEFQKNMLGTLVMDAYFLEWSKECYEAITQLVGRKYIQYIKEEFKDVKLLV